MLQSKKLQLSGRQKAAIFLVSLGSEVSAEIFKHLREDEIEQLTFEIARLDRIARAIYGNPSFWHYAAMPNPPIHIIVEHGRVTLTGVVQDNVERMLARSIATGFNAFSVANELRTEAEVRAALEKVN